MKRFRIAGQPFDTAALHARLRDSAAGACSVFEGWVRDHNDGRPVRGLRYESYVELAESEGERILEEAVERFSLAEAACVHRVGELAIGDLAVWVGASCSSRRRLRGLPLIIDEVKARVPIWKHERAGGRPWLHPRRGEPDHPSPTLAASSRERDE